MRFSIAISLLSAGFASAQTTTAAASLGGLPQCAGSCVGNSLSSTGCSQFDIACICKSSSWIAGLACCVAQACSPADQQATIAYAQQICSTVGVTVPSTASCVSGTGASTTAGGTTAAGTTTTTGAGTTGAGTTGAGTTSAAKTTVASGSSSVTAASTTSKGAGVAQQEFSPAGFLAIAGAGLMMAL